MTELHTTGRRSLLRSAVRSGGIALAGAVLGQAVTTQAVGAKDRHAHALMGSWLVTISPPSGPPVKVLQSFTPGGITITTPIVFTASPPPVEVTAGHGGWVQTDDREFVVTLLHLVRDSSGVLVGSNKSVEHTTLDASGDSWSAVATVTFYSATGEVTRSRTDKVTATRIHVEQGVSTGPRRGR